MSATSFRRMGLTVALALAVVTLAREASAYCPSYTLSSTANTHNCGIEAVPGTNPSVSDWQAYFDRVALGPAQWQDAGPGIPNIGMGCNKPTPRTTVPPQFPCELLKAITFQESSWRQFCVPDSPADQVGGVSRTLISFDCGYGVGQVTSGMHKNEAASFDRNQVASSALYNLATGVRILADKWRATNCVGDNQPRVIEHWYTATWAYNGLSYTNNPANPAYSSTRGVWNPTVGGSAPYQEKIFGRLEHPPSGYWSPVAVAYPALTQVGTTGSPPALPEPSCASPTQCAQTRATHVSSCLPVPDAGADAGLDAGDDAGTDAGPTETDAGVDAAVDGGSDAGVDSGLPGDVGYEGQDSGDDPDPLKPPRVTGGCGCNSGGALLITAAVWLASFRARRRFSRNS